MGSGMALIALVRVWHSTAHDAPPSFPQRVSRAWLERQPAAEQCAGTGPDCASGSVPSPWHPGLCVSKGRDASSPPSPMDRGARSSCALSNAVQTHFPSPPGVPAQPPSRGPLPETPPPLGGLVAGVVCRGASSRSDCGLRSWQAEPRRERASQGSRGGGGPCARALMARLTLAGSR